MTVKTDTAKEATPVAAEPVRGELVQAPHTGVRKSEEQRQVDRLRQREDRILERSMAIVEDAMAAADVDTGSKEIPQEWIAEVGMDGAQRRHRVAQDARNNPKEHPVYLDLAKSVMVGIVKARATQPRDRAPLNVSFTIVAPPGAAAHLNVSQGELPPPADLPALDLDPDEK